MADDDAPRAVEIAHGTGLALTVIGRMQPGAGVTVRAGDGSAIPLRQKGFQHF